MELREQTGCNRNTVYLLPLPIINICKGHFRVEVTSTWKRRKCGRKRHLRSTWDMDHFSITSLLTNTAISGNRDSGCQERHTTIKHTHRHTTTTGRGWKRLTKGDHTMAVTHPQLDVLELCSIELERSSNTKTELCNGSGSWNVRHGGKTINTSRNTV